MVVNQLVRAALLLTVASTAMASHIVLEPAPDIYASNLDVVYSGGELTVTGTAEGFTNWVSNALVLFPITSGAFTLSAKIDAGGVASEGSFAITGHLLDELLVPVYLPSTGVLLSGTVLEGFEFTPGLFDTGQFTFLFSSLAGDLAPLYEALAIVNMSLYTGFPGSFAGDFSTSDFSHVADIGVSTEVPEPGSWSLIAFGALSLAALKRRYSGRPADR